MMKVASFYSNEIKCLPVPQAGAGGGPEGHGAGQPYGWIWQDLSPAGLSVSSVSPRAKVRKTLGQSR